MGTGTILGIYLGIGLGLAIFATVFSGHKRVRAAVFLFVALGWIFIAPPALYRAMKQIKEQDK